MCSITVYGGILMIVVGLIGGFTVLFRSSGSDGVNLLMLVPAGFLVLLTSTVVCELRRSKAGHDADQRQSERDE